jgi:hypothetical protein
MGQQAMTTIGMWRPVQKHLAEWADVASQFRQLQVVQQPREGLSVARQGQVIWGCSVGDSPVALGWDWAEIRSGVVVLACPMNVFSNVTLLSADGTSLDQGKSLLELNNTIHELDWQRAVCSELFWPRALPARFAERTAKSGVARRRAGSIDAEHRLAA